jgi:hypothetical protein
MGFRFRRSTRLGPLRFNFSKSGLSSISVGGRGASFNIPVNRSGGPRSTVGLPGTGLSWSVEHTSDRPTVNMAGTAAGLPNSRRLRPGQLDALKQQLLEVLRKELVAPGSAGALLWENASVSRLLADGSLVQNRIASFFGQLLDVSQRCSSQQPIAILQSSGRGGLVGRGQAWEG